MDAARITHGPGRPPHRPRHYKEAKKHSTKNFSNFFFGTISVAHIVTIMESTRVFVSGLPPTLSDDQLRKHFATRFQVTDAHVLPKRRIGFVGFKSHEVAQQAVSYFNKTYMKMSKISVDIAKPVCALLPIHTCFVSFVFPADSQGGLVTDQ